MNEVFVSCFLLLLLVPSAGGNFIVSSVQSAKIVRVGVRFVGEPNVTLIEAYGGRIVYNYYPFLPALACELTEGAVEALRLEPSVDYVEYDGLLKISGGESLPWGIERIRADIVWDKNGDLIVDSGTPAGQGIKVAVLDTGIDYNHSDLRDRVINGTSCVNYTTSYMDDHWHGTMLAGIISASDNGDGIVGVAPKASLLAVKVADFNGGAKVLDVIEGIKWSVDHGANIISMSLGRDSYHSLLAEACGEAIGKGALLIAPSGNDNKEAIDYPAKLDGVVAVGAVNRSDYRWVNASTGKGSNYGPELDFVAPGHKIYSTQPNGTYGIDSGTSLAVPHVAGVAALIWSSQLIQTMILVPTSLESGRTRRFFRRWSIRPLIWARRGKITTTGMD